MLILKARAAKGAVGSLARAHLFAGLGIDAGHGGEVKRSGKILDHRIQQWLNALIPQPGSTQHGDNRGVKCAEAEATADLCPRQRPC